MADSNAPPALASDSADDEPHDTARPLDPLHRSRYTPKHDSLHEIVLGHMLAAGYLYAGLRPADAEDLPRAAALAVVNQVRTKKQRLASDPVGLRNYSLAAAWHAVEACLKEYKKAAARDVSLDDAAAPFDIPTRKSLEEEMEDTDRRDGIEKAVARLHKGMRLNVQLMREGFTAKEAAQLTGVTVKAVEASRKQALAKLRIALAPYWEDMTGTKHRTQEES
jgi:RNA polymerase sigma factor (sigma-70 family)